MPRQSPDRRWIVLILTTFAIVFTTLQCFGYTQESATSDEPIHLATGYAAVAHGSIASSPLIRHSSGCGAVGDLLRSLRLGMRPSRRVG